MTEIDEKTAKVFHEVKNKYHRKHKVAKSTIFSKGNKINAPKESNYKLHTICGAHLVLAYELDKMLPEGKSKKRVLEILDKCYNYGKRMGDKLNWYHDVLKEAGGWRDDING